MGRHSLTALRFADFLQDFSAEDVSKNNLISGNMLANGFTLTTGFAPNIYPAREEAASATTADPDYAKKAIDACRNGVEALYKVFDSEDDQTLRDQLGDFEILMSSQLPAMSKNVRHPLSNALLKDFSELCSLAKNEKLTQNSRRQILQKLVDDRHVCIPGIVQNIEIAVNEIKVLTYEVPQHFTNVLINTIDDHNMDFMPTKGIKTQADNGNKLHREDPVTYEKHYAAALFNPIAKHFKIPARPDAFLDDSSSIDKLPTAQQREKCKNSFLANFSVDTVVQGMADDYLARVRNFFTKNDISDQSFDLADFDHRWRIFIKDLEPELKLMFGSIDKEILFRPCANEEDRYQVTNDSTLIARSIARNLRTAKILGNFKAAYILGKKGLPEPDEDEFKLKKLGKDIVYVSKTRLVNKQKTKEHWVLDQFIWQDTEQGKKLLAQLAEKSTNDSFIKEIYQGFFKKLPSSLAREMLAASSKENLNALYTYGMSLLKPSEAKEEITLEILQQAVASQNRAAIDFLFKQLSPKQITLDLALQCHQTDVVMQRIKNITPAQLCTPNSKGDSVLTMAMRFKHTKIVDHLIGSMSAEQLYIPDSDNSTVLISALKFKHTEIATHLIKQMGAEHFSMANIHGETVLHLAIILHPEMVEDVIKILKEKITDPKLIRTYLDLPNKYGYTPLRLAMLYKNLDCAKLLMNELSAEQLCLQNSVYNTVLHSSLQCFPAMAEPIIKRLQELIKDPEELRVQLNMQNNMGETPLMLAFVIKQHGCAMLLIAILKKEQFNTENRAGVTTLMFAIDKGDFIAAKKLIKILDTNQLIHQDKEKNTAMLLAQAQHRIDLAWDILQKLIKNPNQILVAQHLAHQNKNGINALIATVKCDQFEFFKEVYPRMDKKDLSLQDNAGNTALMAALLEKYIFVAKSLARDMEYPQLRIKNNDGQTARKIASLNGNTEMEKYFEEKYGWLYSLILD